MENEELGFTHEEIVTLFTALEFVEDKYLNDRMQFIRDQLLNRLGEML